MELAKKSLKLIEKLEGSDYNPKDIILENDIKEADEETKRKNAEATDEEITESELSEEKKMLADKNYISKTLKMINGLDDNKEKSESNHENEVESEDKDDEEKDEVMESDCEDMEEDNEDNEVTESEDEEKDDEEIVDEVLESVFEMDDDKKEEVLKDLLMTVLKIASQYKNKEAKLKKDLILAVRDMKNM